jgi:hypothetical protein
MKRRYSDVFLAALLLELSAAFYTALLAAKTDEELEAATLEGYAQAHLYGALWAALGLLAVQLPRSKKNFGQVLETVAAQNGVRLPRITSKPVLKTIKTQAQTAIERLREARAARTNSVLLTNTSAEARAAGYAARWGVQQGIDDMAAGSSAVDVDGQELELLKTWVRLAARVEKRSWHDALNGVTIPYSQSFRLLSPRGVFLVSRPYDSKLPLGERIGCGHGVRIEPPRDAADVILWDGTNTSFIRGYENTPADNPDPRIIQRNIKEAILEMRGLGVSSEIKQDAAWFAARPDVAEQRAPLVFLGKSGFKVNPNSPYWIDPIQAAKEQFNAGFWSSDNPSHAAIHDAAHELLFANKRVYQAVKAYQFDKEELLIASKVSAYATFSPLKFVSEVFAAQRTGRQLDNETLNLYNQLTRGTL